MSAPEPDADRAADAQARERARRDREALGYDSFFPAWRREREVGAVRDAALAAGGRGVLVDLGTGTGRVLRALAPHFVRSVGVDFSAASLDVARAHAPGAELLCADATATPLEDGIADVVVASQVLQHLPTEAARDALLAEMRRLLVPGGRAVVSCYGYNLRHRLRGREGNEGGLYWFRHSRRDLAERMGRHFRGVRTLALVGLPDVVGWPRLDAILSHVPGWSLAGRSVLGVGTR